MYPVTWTEGPNIWIVGGIGSGRYENSETGFFYLLQISYEKAIKLNVN